MKGRIGVLGLLLGLAGWSGCRPQTPDSATAQPTNEAGQALVKAVTKGDTREAQARLQQGANIETRHANSGRTPLMLAALQGQTEVVRALLAKGADVQARDSVGMTALMWAAFAGKPDIVQALLEKGSDPNAKDDMGNTAAQWGRERPEVLATLRQWTKRAITPPQAKKND